MQEKPAQGSWAVEKPDGSSEDDNDTHHRGVRQVMADFEMEAEAYCQGFNRYHIGEIAEHMEQMAMGPDAVDCRPGDHEQSG